GADVVERLRQPRVHDALAARTLGSPVPSAHASSCIAAGSAGACCAVRPDFGACALVSPTLGRLGSRWRRPVVPERVAQACRGSPAKAPARFLDAPAPAW